MDDLDPSRWPPVHSYYTIQGAAIPSDRTLASIATDPTAGIHENDGLVIHSGFAGLQPGPQRREIWVARRPVQRGAQDSLVYAFNDEVALAAIWLPEPNDLVADAQALYQRLIRTLANLGHPNLIRAWNYLPVINHIDPVSRLERYRAFCLGRHQAWFDPGRSQKSRLSQISSDQTVFQFTLPAASAIGNRGPGLLVYALATNHPVTQVENPRQTSAFTYPDQYGPRSPSFSRAVIVHWPDTAPQLYISGTASVVGHETHHPGDPERQVRETLTNLHAITAQAARQHPDLTGHSLSTASTLKGYVRDPAHTAWLSAALQQCRITADRYELVEGDICRQDLLIEIEAAFYAEPVAPRPRHTAVRTPAA